jgi:hypothetical protein
VNQVWGILMVFITTIMDMDHFYILVQRNGVMSFVIYVSFHVQFQCHIGMN